MKKISNDDYIEVAYETLVNETDKAYLFDIFNDGGDSFWIPKSQIEELDIESKTFEIPLWLAIEKELD